MAVDRSCKGCHYYEFVGPDRDGVDSGFCHRYPPCCSPVAEGDDTNTHSLVMAVDWCGEWVGILRKLKNPVRRRLLKYRNGKE